MRVNYDYEKKISSIQTSLTLINGCMIKALIALKIRALNKCETNA